jgi:hypothetical protein
MRLRNKIISLILCFSILVSFNMFLFIPRAHAIWGIEDVVSDFVDEYSNLGSLAEAIKENAERIAEKLAEIAAANAITAYKILALLAVQKVTALIIGEGDGLLIRNYASYLYTSPQQVALAQMNTFFNTVSKGRLSYLNYEGVGPNYDAYLVAQAKQAFLGTTFVTNLQEQVANPSDLFSGGNMKGIMAYATNCANNVACYTLTAKSQYDKEFAKAQDVARSEQQNGFLPTKTSSGRITKPAALLQNALLQVDQVGTQLIMNADPKSDTSSQIGQIAAGAAISIASRAINYGISDNAGKAAIVAQNSQFPFSLGYSSAGGLNFSAGGTTINTALGSLGKTVGTGGCTVIGNTQVCGSTDVNAAGGRVTTSTQKIAQ